MNSQKNIKKIFPKLKKDINLFLSNEDGKIAKESIVKIGALLGAISLIALNAKDVLASRNHSSLHIPEDCGCGFYCHVNSITETSWDTSKVVAQHQNCATGHAYHSNYHK